MCPTKCGKERSAGGPRLESFGSKIIIILNIFEGTKKPAVKVGGRGNHFEIFAFVVYRGKHFPLSDTINNQPILK